MADALCGPSNALQSFQKHSQVDRTLQQDRLVSRQSPTQGFRSSPGPNAGLLDPEFEAFQAGHLASPPPHFDTRYFAPQNNISHFAHPSQPQASLPDWANDFQRLHIAPAHPASFHQSSAPAVQRAQEATPPQTSWHQDFMQSQQPTMSFHRQPQTMFNSFQATPWDHQQPAQFLPASASQGKQKMQEQHAQWNAEAFAKAFDDASMDAVETEPTYSDDLDELLKQEIRREMERESEVTEWIVQPAGVQEDGQHYDDGLSQEMLEREIAREIQMDARETAQEYRMDVDEQAKAMGQRMNHLQGLDLSHDFLAVDEEIRIGEEHEYSDDPHPFLRMDDVMHQPGHDLAHEEQQETTASSPRPIDEDLARTAGQLLQSVEHDTSDKFQSSVFLQLMRRLRDKEVTVEGENFVETGDFGLAGPTISATPQIIPADEQDSDLGRHGGISAEVREDPEPEAASPERSQTPDFDAPGPPFEDWRNRLWAGMPGMVTT